MKRPVLLFCFVLLSCVAVPSIVFAGDNMGNMPMPAATAAAAPQPAAAPANTSSPSGDSAAPWRIATFALAVLAVIALAVSIRDKRPVTVAVFAAAAVVIVALAFFQARTSSQTAGMVDMGRVRGVAAVPVTAVQLGMDSSGSEISAPAQVAPYLVQTIAARVPGVLTDLSAYAGDRVSAGETLAHLDEPELQMNAQAAEAAVQAAQSSIQSAQNGAVAATADIASTYERVRYWHEEIARERKLLAAGAVSPQEYQDEKAQAASAESAYDAARAKAQASADDVRSAQALAAQASANAQSQRVSAGYTSVIAPDDAVVMKRLVDPGTYVTAGTPILQLAVLGRLRVQAQISQEDMAAVQIGTPIDIVIDGGKTLHGRVTSVSPVADPATHTAIAEAIVENTGEAYQPGAYVRALLHTKAVQGGSFSVPSAAIVGGEHPGIWINAGGTAHRVSVTVVGDDGTTAQVRGELHASDRVIVAGGADLEEGQRVTETAQ